MQEVMMGEVLRAINDGLSKPSALSMWEAGEGIEVTIPAPQGGGDAVYRLGWTGMKLRQDSPLVHGQWLAAPKRGETYQPTTVPVHAYATTGGRADWYWPGSTFDLSHVAGVPPISVDLIATRVELARVMSQAKEFALIRLLRFLGVSEDQIQVILASLHERGDLLPATKEKEDLATKVGRFAEGLPVDEAERDREEQGSAAGPEAQPGDATKKEE